MDRTEASDAFNAGSIPAGCIITNYGRCIMEYNKKQTKEERKARFREIKENLKYVILDHKMIIMPISLVVLVVVTVLVAVTISKDDKALETLEALESLEGTQGEPKTATMELNAYPAVNDLVGKYFDALEAGDTAGALAINQFLNESEQLYIVEMGEFIDRFTTIEVYTKPGPIENSYIAYIYYEMKFIGSDVEGPGMVAYYICCDADGNYYINEDPNEPAEITAYIEEMSVQDDVVELNNRVSVEFNNLITNDLVFSQFYSDLLAQLTIRVSEALVEIEPEQVTEEIPETVVEPEVVTEVKAKATDVVNIRSSASQTADKKGKAQIGEIFDVIKIWENGWTEVEYEGGSGFIKSEYVSVIEEAQEPESGSGDVIDTVTANTTVNIRKSASQTSEKVGVVYEGEKLDLLEKRSDGWSKIRYDGKTAYVKSEFVD